MSVERVKYTKEFKEEAVKLITEQGYKITEAARNLGINADMLRRWKREPEIDPEEREMHQELKHLRRERKTYSFDIQDPQ